MSDQNPSDHSGGINPDGIPLIPGPLTPAEQKAEKEREERETKDKADRSFQERQVNAVEASNNLARKNFSLSIVVAFIAALACGGTWYQSRISTHSLEKSQATLEQMKMDAQISSAQFQTQIHHFDDGLGRTGLLAIHAGEQAKASQDAAGAAKSAANTAKNSLEVSERAYLTTDRPVIEGKDAAMPVVNRGHIPSGIGVVVVHEATINTQGPKAAPEIHYQPIEAHWKHFAVNNLAPGLVGDPLKIPVFLPSLDANKMDSGYQQVILVGSITYNDGFPNTPDQVWDFCYISVLYTEPNRPTWGACDPSQYLAPIILDDGYPKNEYK